MRVPRRVWRWALQIIVVLAVATLVLRALRRHWDEFRSLEFAFDWNPGALVLAVMTVGITYVLQIESWRRVLAGWAQPLSFRAAARIWWLANLGRYVPGKIWSVAGLVLIAQRAGVPAWVTGSSAVAMQALGLGTCVALIAATVAGAASPVGLGLAALVAAAIILALTLQAPARLVIRGGGPGQFRPLPLSAVLASGALTQLSWVTYGAAFWLLADGLGFGATLALPQAAGIFALGYLLGLLAVFAPGGVGVRELAYVGLLTPAVGSAGAIALSVGSRLLLTATEAGAGLVALFLKPGERRIPDGDRGA